MLSMLAAMTTAVGCKSDSSSNSGNNKQTEISVPSEQKRQIDVTPQFSSLFESSVGANAKAQRLAQAEQLFKGTLSILNSTNQEVEDSPFNVTVRMDETNWIAALDRTLALIPGSYTLKMSLTKGTRQYYGEQSLTVKDGINQATKLTIHPVIGKTGVQIGEIARLSHVQFRYPKSQLSNFTSPKLEITVNGNSQGVFAINREVTGDTAHQYTEGFIDLSNGRNTVKLGFFDGNLQVGKSKTAQETRDIVPGEDFLMDLIPLEGKVNFEPLIDGGDAEISISIPDQAVAEAGSAGNLKVRTSLLQNSSVVVQAETTVQGSQSSYQANLTLKDVYYGKYKLLIEYFDKESQERLGECNNEITLDASTRDITCNSLKLRRNAVASGDLLASVHVTVLDSDGLPVKGAIVKLGETEKTTVGNDQFGTDSYGHFYEKPGEYTYTATFGARSGSKTVTLSALQSKNLEITLDRLIPVSSKRLALGHSHSCFLKENGTIKCWGFGMLGTMGNNSTTEKNPTPIQVSGINNVTMISAGGHTTCALLRNETVKCWGFNGYGVTGNNTTRNITTPVSINNLSNVTTIRTGEHYACALGIAEK